MENAPVLHARIPGPSASGGFILIFAMLMVLGISATGVAMFYNAYLNKITAQNYKHRVQGLFAADGMITLLADEAEKGHAALYLDTAFMGKISGDVYENLSGTGVGILQSALAGKPTRTAASDYLGSNWNLRNYGVRWRGYLCPPLTGSYTFLLRSSDASAFYLAQNDKPGSLSKTPIAYLDQASKQWPVSGSGLSEAVTLQGGKRYYFEYLHKAGVGADFGQVGWNGPDWIKDRPILGKNLMRYSETEETVMSLAKVGTSAVQYKFTEIATDIYNAYAEAVQVVGKNDSSYRISLNQVINMQGRSLAPPDTIWTHVIYYDYHSDGSSPEFEQLGGPLFLGKNMVKRDTLRYETANADYFGAAAIGKPILSATPIFDCTVNDWFHAWQPGNFFVPTGFNDCTPKAVATDTALKNIVIRDSLPFIHDTKLGPNSYVLDRSGKNGAPSFFPLDGRGFGNEGKSHNFSFCMELHTSFQHASGLTLDFTGDDDVWLFINDSLVMDLGGIHSPSPAFLELDDLTDLKFGETYDFDFFSCERHTGGSSIRMVTSLPILSTPGKRTVSWKRDYGLLD